MIVNRYTRCVKLVAIIMLLLFLLSMVLPCVIPLVKVVLSTDKPSYSVEPVMPETTAHKITEPEINLNNTPVLFSSLTYIAWYDTDLSNKHVKTVQDAIGTLNTTIASGEYTDNAVSQMQQEIVRLRDIVSATEADVSRYTAWKNEYYYAAKTWKFLMQRGYSTIVASAIIGNMMVETSGGTLKLQPTIYSYDGGYYGLCQWSLYYKPNMADLSFEDQLTYLHIDMEREFKNFGFCYKSGFTYDDFLALDDPADAALAFAKVYERCGSGSYSARQSAAKVAYTYFTGDMQ